MWKKLHSKRERERERRVSVWITEGRGLWQRRVSPTVTPTCSQSSAEQAVRPVPTGLSPPPAPDLMSYHRARWALTSPSHLSPSAHLWPCNQPSRSPPQALVTQFTPNYALCLNFRGTKRKTVSPSPLRGMGVRRGVTLLDNSRNACLQAWVCFLVITGGLVLQHRWMRPDLH